MSVVIDGTNGVTASASFYGQSTFTGTYTDGIVVDYTTGTGRITVGASDGFKIRNNGISSPVDLVTVDSSGNVGIGTSSPAVRLAVLSSAQQNSLFASSNATSCYTAYQYNTSTVSGYIGNGSALISTASATDFIIRSEGALAFGTNGGTERARIDSSGNLLVGTTSSLGLITAKSSALETQVLYRTTATAGAAVSEWLSDNHGTQSTCAYVKADGGLANYSANNTNLSDARTKTDIADAGNYLAKICAVPVRTFKYKNQVDGLSNLGVIAQEVEVVAPELIDASGFGETPEDGIPLKAIYQTDLQYALMKCIQEQQAIIEQLRADVETLKCKA